MENNFPEGRREFLHQTALAGALMAVFKDPAFGEHKIDEAYKKIHANYAEGCSNIADLLSKH